MGGGQTYKESKSFPLASPGQYTNDQVKGIKLAPYRGEDIYHVELHSGETVRLERFSTLKSLLEKDALIQWSANQAVEHVDRMWDLEEEYPQAYKDKVLSQARKAWMDNRDQKGSWGTQAHKIVERYLGTGEWPADWSEIPTPVQNSVRLFSDFWKTAKLKCIGVEKYVYNMPLAYAGRLDWLLVNEAGETGVGDLKTSDNIYPEMLIQIVAYSFALIELGWDIRWAMVVRCGRNEKKPQIVKIDRAMIDHYTRGWKMVCLFHPYWKQLKSLASKENRAHDKVLINDAEAQREADIDAMLRGLIGGEE